MNGSLIHQTFNTSSVAVLAWSPLSDYTSLCSKLQSLQRQSTDKKDCGALFHIYT